MGAYKCSKCGQIITGATFTFQKEKYCGNCYHEVVEQSVALEKDKKELYEYICSLLGIIELPENACISIDYALKEGKTVSNIKNSLWYYYSILGNSVDSGNNIGFIIRDYNDKAQSYISNMKELQEKNIKVNLDIPPVTIIIDPKNKKKKKDFKYKMEDL